MIFNSKIDTVNSRYGFKVRFMERLNISQLEGKEFRIVGFIYKEYDDGYRCFFVTDTDKLIRLPKWYSGYLNNLKLDELEELKSGDYVLTDIHKKEMNDGYFTTNFRLVRRPLDNSIPFGEFNF